MRRQLYIFLSSVMFFTRIPVKKDIPYSEDYLNSASKFLPVIGWFIGGISAIVYYTGIHFFPHSLAILFSMISSILVTGAFHEDGFADVCDGFGGGWTKTKILEIMKDSRIGVYGTIGLIFMLGTKYLFLYEMPHSLIIKTIIGAHVLSRINPVLFIYFYSYAREDASSKTKPLGKKLSHGELLFALISGLSVLFIFPDYRYSFVLVALLICFFFFARYIVKWIGGFTGDCLGAMQQISEIVVYLFVLGYILNIH